MKDGYGGAVTDRWPRGSSSAVARHADDRGERLGGRRRGWGQDLSDLFLRAYQNLDDDPSPTLERLELDEGDELLAYSGDDFFVTSRLLFVEHLVDDIPEHGLVVAVPNRHVLLVYRIRDLRVVQAIQRLIAMVQGLYERGPGSLAPDLYWWQRRGARPAAGGRGGRAGRLPRPRSFVELLNGLT